MTEDHDDTMTTRTATPDGAASIYLDYQATTPTDPRVLEAMLPFFTRQSALAPARLRLGR